MKEPIKYTFSLEKHSELNKKALNNIIAGGDYELLITQNTDSPDSEYCFTYNNTFQKGVKEPLVFSPFKWVYEKEKNKAHIKAKSNLETIWKRYRDKHRRNETQAYFLMLERLFFHSPTGLEEYSFSFSSYLPYFIQGIENVVKDDIVNGVDWLLIPLDIPVNTYYKCINADDDEILLEGWIVLDNDKLDELLTKDKFRSKARSYHFSKDFHINSNIKVLFDRKSLYLKNCLFEVEIEGENGNLKEAMKYKIDKKIEQQERYFTRKSIIID